ncbi:MAG: WhiB family transcriptional regulator [bacterium]
MGRQHEVSPHPDPDWIDRAACRGMDYEAFFPVGEQDPRRAAAKDFCRTQCPVRWHCLYDALAVRPSRYGVFGGYDMEEIDKDNRSRLRARARDRRVLEVRPVLQAV